MHVSLWRRRTQGDSIEGIYDTLKECACISKSAGGIGLSIHNIRAVGSYIRGTNGNSNGIVPMLRVFNDTARRGPCSITKKIPAQKHARDEERSAAMRHAGLLCWLWLCLPV